MLEVCGQGGCGAVSLLADGQCGQPKGKLWTMGLSAFSLCHGRISLLWSAAGPCPPSLAVTWQHEQPLSRWGLLQCCGLQKFALGTSVSFHFHCNKVLQCAVIGTDLLLRLTKTWKPGEVPWEGNVCNLDLIPLLEKNLSLYLSSCKDSANVLALLRRTKEGSEDISCAVLDTSVLSQGPLQHVVTSPCF